MDNMDNIYKRLYKNFNDYNRGDSLAIWKNRKYREAHYFKCLSDLSSYKELFESFGTDGITDGINCEHFHKYSTWSEFNNVIQKAENLVKKTKNITLDDLSIEPICQLYGVPYNNKIIPPIFYKFGLILNDLINLYNINPPKTILEIGAGYGGFPYLTLNKFPNSKYIIIDIQPTLSVSSYFLHKMGKNIVLPNEFTSLDSFIKSDSDCLFLHPEQIRDIPNKSIDLCINMDSLLEIPIDIQIEYISQINRILIDHFHSNNRAKLQKSLLSNSSQYKDFYNNCEYREYPIYEPIQGNNRENQIIFQLTLSPQYQTELFTLHNGK